MDHEFFTIHDCGPPVTDAQIDRLSKLLGFSLPSSYVRFLKTHNGGTTGERAGMYNKEMRLLFFPSLFLQCNSDFDFLDLAAEYALMQGVLHAFDKKLLPVASDASGHYLVLACGGSDDGAVFECGFDSEELDGPLFNSFEEAMLALSFAPDYADERWESIDSDWLRQIVLGPLSSIIATVTSERFAEVTSDGDTACHLAVWSSRPEILRVLANAGAALSVINDRGSTPLHVAASGGEVDCIKILASHGCPLDLRDDSGRTPLLTATAYKHVDAVAALLRCGANRDVCDHDGRSFADIIAESDDFDVLTRLGLL